MSDAAVSANPAPGGRDLKPWLAPVAVVLALVIGLGAIVVLSRRAAAPDAPPDPPSFTAPVKANPVEAHNVQSVAGGTIRIASGADASGGAVLKDLEATASTRFDLLAPMVNSEIATGDWVQLIGVPNQVKSFAVRSVIVTPGGGQPGEDGLVRSPGGFVGFEATQDPNERPVLAGRVTGIASREGTTETARGLRPVVYTVLTLEGQSGTFTVDLQDGGAVPLWKVTAGSRESVQDGDRVAFRQGESPVSAVLVFPGGAQ